MSTDILVVDDSQLARAIIGDILRQPDRSIREAGNGREALELIAAVAPDLVVTDLRMPEMDGLQLVCELHKTHPTVPVILVTAHGSEAVACEALREGAASYVAKQRLEHDLNPITSRVLAVADRKRSHEHLFGRLKKLDFTFELVNDLSVVAPLVRHLQDTLSWMCTCSEAELPRVGIALDEALVNAIIHGNLEVSSELREGGGEEFHLLIKERQSQSPFAERTVSVQASIRQDEAVITIKDEGPGFDHQAVPDPTDPKNLARASGRGMLLMRTFMDDVRYNAKGNGVTLLKRKNQSAR